jgi:uncharacterized membrane protein (UPF0127 family)
MVNGTHDFRHVRVARSLIDRTRGLIGFPADRLAIFIPNCGSIHTCFVKASIDVVFVDGDNRIVAIEANVRPWRVRIGPRATKSVLELPAGGAARAGLALGETIVVA